MNKKHKKTIIILTISITIILIIYLLFVSLIISKNGEYISGRWEMHKGPSAYCESEEYYLTFCKNISIYYDPTSPRVDPCGLLPSNNALTSYFINGVNEDGFANGVINHSTYTWDFEQTSKDILEITARHKKSGNISSYTFSKSDKNGFLLSCLSQESRYKRNNK